MFGIVHAQIGYIVGAEARTEKLSVTDKSQKLSPAHEQVLRKAPKPLQDKIAEVVLTREDSTPESTQAEIPLDGEKDKPKPKSKPLTVSQTNTLEGANLKKTNDLKIITDLYNLQIRPNLSENTSPDPNKVYRIEPQIREFDNLLSETDLRKLKRVLERHAPQIFNFETREAYEKAMRSLKGLAGGVKDIPFPHGTLGHYHSECGIDWRASEDFRDFLSDYVMMQRLIEDFLDDYQLPKDCGVWLQTLWRNLQIQPPGVGDAFAFAPKKSGETEWNQKEYWDLSGVEIIDQTESSIHHVWHGLAIYHIGLAVVKGLLGILSGKAVIKRCRLESCEKIFRPSDRGFEQKFCSGRCRAKAHRQYNRTFVD